jgi:hypothetical protein
MLHSSPIAFQNEAVWRFHQKLELYGVQSGVGTRGLAHITGVKTRRKVGTRKARLEMNENLPRSLILELGARGIIVEEEAVSVEVGARTKSHISMHEMLRRFHKVGSSEL